MTFWTSQAWTNSHLDFFTRNIITTGQAAVFDAALTERNNFKSNAVGVPWPDYDDVTAWLHAEGYVGATGADGASNTQALNAALEAARSRISERVRIQVHPVDVDGNVLTDQLETVPPHVWLATVIQAAKWYRRRLSPDGTLGANAFGSTIRTGRFDSDVEELLANDRRYGLA